MKEPRPLQFLDSTHVLLGGKPCLYFAGCDYFRLAWHPAVLKALRSASNGCELSVAASRLTTGNHPVFLELERVLARFFHAPSALLLPTGYLTGMAVAQALAGEFTHAFIDERSHAALRDAARFLDCPLTEFSHRNPEALAAAISEAHCARSAVLVLTDGLFARDGAAAPLAEYFDLLPKTAWVWVDDAHGAGVMGAAGRGTPEHAGVKRSRLIQTITLSKAFGCYGGAVITDLALRHRMLTKARCFAGSTPLPLPVARAAVEAVELLRRNKGLRQALHNNAAQLKENLVRSGFRIDATPGPIVALPPLADSANRKISVILRRNGVFPSLIRYLNGATGCFRFVISSAHSTADLKTLTQALLLCRQVAGGAWFH